MYSRDCIYFLVNRPIYSKWWWWWCLHEYVCVCDVWYLLWEWASFTHLNADEQILNEKKTWCNPILKVIVRPYSEWYTLAHTLSLSLSFIDYFGRLCQSIVEFGRKLIFSKEFATFSCEFLSISFHFITNSLSVCMCHSMAFFSWHAV